LTLLLNWKWSLLLLRLVVVVYRGFSTTTTKQKFLRAYQTWLLSADLLFYLETF
jgi:hypothetical protein